MRFSRPCGDGLLSARALYPQFQTRKHAPLPPHSHPQRAPSAPARAAISRRDGLKLATSALPLRNNRCGSSGRHSLARINNEENSGGADNGVARETMERTRQRDTPLHNGSVYRRLVPGLATVTKLASEATVRKAAARQT
ncbi:hypothetical protein MTO96_019498 [Rhipicephalus appendiculatus]